MVLGGSRIVPLLPIERWIDEGDRRNLWRGAAYPSTKVLFS